MRGVFWGMWRKWLDSHFVGYIPREGYTIGLIWNERLLELIEVLFFRDFLKELPASTNPRIISAPKPQICRDV